MAPLMTAQQVLMWLCLFPANENSSKWKKSKHILFCIGIVLVLLGCLISSFVHFTTFLSTDLEKSLYSLLQIASTASMLYVLVVGFLLRHKITAILQHLPEIYKTPFEVQFLVDANSNCEWMWQIYFKFMLNGYNVFIVLTSAISVYVSQLINGKFDTKYLYHPFKLV